MRCFIFQFKSKPPSSLSLSITIVKAYPNNRFLNQYSEVVFTACQRVFVNKHMQRAKQRLSTSSPRHPCAALHKTSGAAAPLCSSLSVPTKRSVVINNGSRRFFLTFRNRCYSFPCREFILNSHGILMLRLYCFN